MSSGAMRDLAVNVFGVLLFVAWVAYVIVWPLAAIGLALLA